MNFLNLEFLFNKYKTITSVIELGSQNFYQNYKNIIYGCYANEYYKIKKCTLYNCIDINGENNACKYDLSKIIEITNTYDLVTDFGTSEHVSSTNTYDLESLYNCNLNKYNLCNINGLIIGSNPKTNHWKNHGHFYFTQDFYKNLAIKTNMEIILLEESPAMQNYIDGMEIRYILKKKNNSKWLSYEDFIELSKYVYNI